MNRIKQIKTELLLELEEAKRRSSVEVPVLAREVALLEAVLALEYLSAGNTDEAVVSMVSQASCLRDAQEYGEAGKVLFESLALATSERTRSWIARELDATSRPQLSAADLKQVVAKKNALLFQLEEAKRTGGSQVSRLASEAANIEAIIANHYLTNGRPDRAAANLVSQASCLADASRTEDIRNVLEKARGIAPAEKLKAWIDNELEKASRVAHPTILVKGNTTADVLQQAIHHVAAETQADSCSIFLWDAAQRDLVLRAATGRLERFVGSTGSKIGEDLTEQVFRVNAEIRSIEAPARAGRKGDQDQILKRDMQSPSFLGVPIQHGDKVMGVLTVEFTDDRPLPDFAERYAAISASMIALSLIVGAIEGATLPVRLPRANPTKRKPERLKPGFSKAARAKIAAAQRARWAKKIKAAQKK